jgi:hypothetical protein
MKRIVLYNPCETCRVKEGGQEELMGACRAFSQDNERPLLSSSSQVASA